MPPDSVYVIFSISFLLLIVHCFQYSLYQREFCNSSKFYKNLLGRFWKWCILVCIDFLYCFSLLIIAIDSDGSVWYIPESPFVVTKSDYDCCPHSTFSLNISMYSPLRCITTQNSFTENFSLDLVLQEGYYLLDQSIYIPFVQSGSTLSSKTSLCYFLLRYKDITITAEGNVTIECPQYSEEPLGLRFNFPLDYIADIILSSIHFVNCITPLSFSADFYGYPGGNSMPLCLHTSSFLIYFLIVYLNNLTIDSGEVALNYNVSCNLCIY